MYSALLRYDKRTIATHDVQNTSAEVQEENDQPEEAATRRRTWDESYALMEEFHEKYGHADVPSAYKGDSKLAKWVQNQRIRKNRMTPEKYEKLDKLGFTWENAHRNRWDQLWEDKLQQLQEYKEEYGDCLVPRRWKLNPQLASWVATQRRQYALTSTSLTPYRIQKLESIGFEWRLNKFLKRESDAWEEAWEHKFEQLQAFKEEHGHCRVPQKYKEKPSLGTWVYTQRQFNSGHGAILRPDRKQRLEEIGFTWDFEGIYDNIWMSKYNQLLELKEKHQRHPAEPSNGESVRPDKTTWAFKNDNEELWSWEHQQQLLYESGRLDTDREAMLREIGYWETAGLEKKE